MTRQQSFHAYRQVQKEGMTVDEEALEYLSRVSGHRVLLAMACRAAHDLLVDGKHAAARTILKAALDEFTATFSGGVKGERE